MGGTTLSTHPRLRALAVAVVALALAACGSTVNRPLQVSAEVGGTGRTATSSAGAGDGTGTDGSTGTGTDGAAVGTTGGTTGSGAGATGAGGTTGTGGATATTAAPVAGGPVKTGPVQVGFVLARTSNAAAFGGSLPEQVDQRDIYAAMAKSVNAHGGLHGRPVVPVFATTDSASNTWDADLAAACSSFTEDHQVEAVLGRISGLSDAMEACLNKHRIPHLAGNLEPYDSKFLAQYPYLFDTISMTYEQRTRLKVDYGIAHGILTPSDKIGIVFAGCPPTSRSWEQDAKPYFASKGLDVASVFATGCPHGANDATTEVGKVGNLVLQFRSAKVNKIMFHSDDLAGLFVIANAAEAQGYRPSYYVTTLATTAVSGTQIPPAQRANVQGLGWSPAGDVARAQWPAFNPAATTCLADLKAQGVVPVTPLDYNNAFWACDSMYLLREAVDADGGRFDGPSVAAAIEAMGTRHVSPATYDGTTRYGPGRHTAVATAYPFGWDAGCACYRYSGAKVTVP